MSIYYIIHELLVPYPGTITKYNKDMNDYVPVKILGVPASITEDYPFLTEPVAPNSRDPRTVVIIKSNSTKGSTRYPEEYLFPLFVFSGSAYKLLTFDKLMSMLYRNLNL